MEESPGCRGSPSKEGAPIWDWAPYPTVSLAQARLKARENRSLAKSGGNPLAVKQEEAMLAEVPTFEALARLHIAENLHSWKKHQAQGAVALHS